VQAMKGQGDVIHFINEAYKHCKPIGLTGQAAELLAKSSIESKRDMDNSDVNVNMGMVTAGNESSLAEFMEKFRDAIIEHRHWDREKDGVPA
jgi:catalase